MANLPQVALLTPDYPDCRPISLGQDRAILLLPMTLLRQLAKQRTQILWATPRKSALPSCVHALLAQPDTQTQSRSCLALHVHAYTYKPLVLTSPNFNAKVPTVVPNCLLSAFRTYACISANTRHLPSAGICANLAYQFS